MFESIRNLIPWGTFFIDPLHLYIGGYLGTYLLFKFVTPRVKIGTFRLIVATAIAPLVLIGLWIGGILPYFNWVDPTTLYPGVLPDWFICPAVEACTGNDFMWNGLGFHLFFDRVVPTSLQPTSQFFWFNVWAFIIWFVVFPFSLFKGVILGLADAQVEDTNPLKWGWAFMKVVATGVFLSFSVVAITALLVTLHI